MDISTQEITQQYLDAGLRLCAIPRNRKGPTTPRWNHDGVWLQSNQWEGNIGLLHAWSGTCAVDIDDLEKAAHWFTERGVDIQRYLDAPERWPQISSGRSNRAKLVFALPSPRNTRKVEDGDVVVEFRCATAAGLTVQDVLPPSLHPETRQAYQWVGSPDAVHPMVAMGLLPPLPEEILACWDELDTEKTTAPAPPVAKADPDEVERALGFIDPDCDRDTWLRVGMALHADDQDDFARFDTWSSRGVKYVDRNDTWGRWRSFGECDNPVTIASLFKQAIAGGYSPTTPEDLDGLFAPLIAQEAKQDTFESLETLIASLPVTNEAVKRFLFRIQPLEPVDRSLLVNTLKQHVSGRISAKAIEAAERAQRLRYTDKIKSVQQGFPRINPDNDAPIDHLDNFLYMCAKHDIQIRYNSMLNRLDVDIPGISERWHNTDVANLQTIYLEDYCSAEGLNRVTTSKHMRQMGMLYEYHPFLEFLKDAGPWDGKSRLRHVLDTLPVAPDKKQMRDTLVTKWLISVVAAVKLNSPRHALANGRRNGITPPPRGVLVLVGDQAIGKTTWLKYLTPRGMFGEGLHLDPSDKDSITLAVRNLIAELGELDSTFRRGDISRLKAFLSKDRDVLRLPYAEHESERPRRTVFAGTVNDQDFLKDQTGNTRFWPVELIDNINLDTMRLLHENPNELAQFWREIESLFDGGTVSWWLDKDELKALEEHNQAHREITPVEEALDDGFNWEEFNNPEMRLYLSFTQIARHLELGMITSNSGVGRQLRDALKRKTGLKAAIRRRVDKKIRRVYPMPPRNNVLSFGQTEPKP